MNNKKLKSISILALIALILSIIFIIITFLIYKYNNFHILISIFFITFISLYTFVAYLVLIQPIEDATQVLKNINDRNFSFYCKYSPTKELKELNIEINKLAKNLKLCHNKYIEQTNINESYINYYNKDLEYRKVLLTSISHEIKTPLTIINNYACAIKDNIYSTKEEIDEALDNIIIQSEKTNHMLYEVVDMYKLESNKVALEKQNINLEILVHDILLDIKPLIIKYNQKIDILGVLDIDLYVNYMLFEKAIKNILVNAVTYSPKNERITIELVNKDKYQVLEIINYGINISREDLTNIFEPFYRADKARSQSADSGNGLGLHLVKEVLNRHHFDYGMTNIRNGVKFYIIFKNN